MSPRRRSRWRWLAGIVLVVLAIFTVLIFVVIRYSQPILRARVVETLSARFKSRVDLAYLRVWIANGLHVEGKGLKVYGVNDPNPSQPGVQPLFEIGGFHFQTALRNLFREPMNVDTIYVQGLTINIPPKNERKEMTGFKRQSLKAKITVGEFKCV